MVPFFSSSPPRFTFNPERLETFLKTLPAEFRYAFEFRDRTWLNDHAYEILSKHNAALCIYSMGSYISPKVITADFTYIRFHGPSDFFPASYEVPLLSTWVDEIAPLVERGRDIYCYFNNDYAGYAVKDALALQDLVCNLRIPQACK